MPRSESSSSSGRSRRSSRSSKSNSSVSSKSFEVDLPKKSFKMDCILYFSGANPKKMRHLRREEFVETYDVSYHGGTREEERTWSQWYFVGIPDEYDQEYADDDDTSTVFSKARSSSKRSSRGRRSSRGSKERLWAKRKSRKDSDSSDESESDEDDSDDGSDYGYQPQGAPPPPMFHGHPPPPHGMPRGPPPQQRPQDGGGDIPAFFTVRGGQ